MLNVMLIMVEITLYVPNCICNQLLLAYHFVSCFFFAVLFFFFSPVQSYFLTFFGLCLNTAENSSKKEKKKKIECVPGILIKIKADTVNLRIN